ncbi:MAG TPA: cupredoxin domain-containing protein [Pyrinomonadaceae bacterium]|nr:cupredoxin domain-containing protein [Pyrinomonadaceae bacterium]
MKYLIRSAIAVSLIVFAFALAASAQATRKNVKPKTQSVRVVINEQGYSPGSFRLRKGVPARVTFLRTTDRTCGTEIVIPAYGINRQLPLDRSVSVSFTPKRTGEFGFTCGMNMMHGKIIVR